MATLPIQLPGEEIVGSVRTFGEYGPMYQVTGTAPPRNGEAMMSLLVIESGETLNYELEAILADPEKP